MFNREREESKKKIFLALTIVAAVAEVVIFVLALIDVLEMSVIVIPLLCAVVMNMFYRNSKKALEENDEDKNPL